MPPEVVAVLLYNVVTIPNMMVKIPIQNTTKHPVNSFFCSLHESTCSPAKIPALAVARFLVIGGAEC